MLGASVNGKPTVSKTVTEGSIPSAPANPPISILSVMANKIAGFFKEVKLEMGKVSWSTREELIGSTIVVLVSLAILTLFIGFCDFFLAKIVNTLPLS